MLTLENVTEKSDWGTAPNSMITLTFRSSCAPGSLSFKIKWCVNWAWFSWKNWTKVDFDATGEGETHQVEVPWMSRVAFQSLLSQALHQQRDHSMVAGDGGAEGGDRGWRQGGDRDKRERERGREGRRRKRRRNGRATPACMSVRLVRRRRRKVGRGAEGETPPPHHLRAR